VSLLYVLCWFITGGSTDTTVTLFDIGIPQGDKYKTDIRSLFLVCRVTLVILSVWNW